MEGGLYANQFDDGMYIIIKILKVEEDGVHVRMYSNVYESVPKNIDESTLYLAGMDKRPNERLGVGHVPVSARSFRTWKIVFIQQSTVTPEELEGYQEWKQAGGGYF